MKLPRGVRLTPVGVKFPSGLRYASWASVGVAIARARRTLTWAIGDWILYGEAEYGETYSQAVSATGYPEHSLITIASVCERIPRAIRRAELSFEHHRAVAYLPVEERELWLTKAVTGKWTREELRERLQGTTGNRQEEGQGALTCPKCGFLFTVPPAAKPRSLPSASASSLPGRGEVGLPAPVSKSAKCVARSKTSSSAWEAGGGSGTETSTSRSARRKI